MDRRLAAALLLGAALLGVGLGAFPLLEPDEGRYADVARSVLEGSWLVPRLDGVSFHDKPPLVPWLVAAAFALSGSRAEGVARLPGALAGLLGLVLAAWLARGVSSPRGRSRAGYLAALVLGGAPLWLALARILTLDVPFATLVTLSW